MSIPHKARESKKKTFAPSPLIISGGDWVPEKLGSMPTATELLNSREVSETGSSRLLPFMAHPTGQGQACTV